MEVRRSSLDTPTKRRARAGFKMNIVEAGDGLFATRRFKAGEHILDYRYIHGVSRNGDEVDWLSADAFSERYAPSDGMPLGNGKTCSTHTGRHTTMTRHEPEGLGGKQTQEEEAKPHASREATSTRDNAP